VADRLTLKGLGAADGTYEFNLAELVSINGAEALNLREQQKIKILSGYRGLEIREAVSVLDPAMLVALIAVIVDRSGKTVNDRRLWDAKILHSQGDETADLSPYRIAVEFHVGAIEEPADNPDDNPDNDDDGEGDDTSPPE
jgi:hypothetical protein